MSSKANDGGSQAGYVNDRRCSEGNVVGSKIKVVSKRVTLSMASNCYPQTVARYRARIQELGTEDVGNGAEIRGVWPSGLR